MEPPAAPPEPFADDPAYSERLPLYLTAWRHSRNYTQRELAERSDVAVTSVNEIETGKRTPRPTTLRRLAHALGIEEWDLYRHPREEQESVVQLVRTLGRLSSAIGNAEIGGVDGRAMAHVFRFHLEQTGASLFPPIPLEPIHLDPARTQADTEERRRMEVAGGGIDEKRTALDLWFEMGETIMPYLADLRRELDDVLTMEASEYYRNHMAFLREQTSARVRRAGVKLLTPAEWREALASRDDDEQEL